MAAMAVGRVCWVLLDFNQVFDVLRADMHDRTMLDKKMRLYASILTGNDYFRMKSTYDDVTLDTML